jgi:hypothetical protein
MFAELVELPLGPGSIWSSGETCIGPVPVPNKETTPVANSNHLSATVVVVMALSGLGPLNLGREQSWKASWSM